MARIVSSCSSTRRLVDRAEPAPGCSHTEATVSSPHAPLGAASQTPGDQTSPRSVGPGRSGVRGSARSSRRHRTHWAAATRPSEARGAQPRRPHVHRTTPQRPTNPPRRSASRAPATTPAEPIAWLRLPRPTSRGERSGPPCRSTARPSGSSTASMCRNLCARWARQVTTDHELEIARSRAPRHRLHASPRLPRPDLVRLNDREDTPPWDCSTSAPRPVTSTTTTVVAAATSASPRSIAARPRSASRSRSRTATADLATVHRSGGGPLVRPPTSHGAVHETGLGTLGHGWAETRGRGYVHERAAIAPPGPVARTPTSCCPRCAGSPRWSSGWLLGAPLSPHMAELADPAVAQHPMRHLDPRGDLRGKALPPPGIAVMMPLITASLGEESTTLR